MKSFDKKIAVVTGAASGLGRALAQELCRRGATVVVTDINAKGVKQTAAALRSEGCAASAVPSDVSDAAAFNALIAGVIDRHGHIDYLFNNAGVCFPEEILGSEDATWRRTVDVNMWGVVNGIRAVLPHMSGRRRGHIVNVASVVGLIPMPAFAAYTMTKHAVVGLSESLRIEAKAYGVDVSVVCPGLMRTGLADRIVGHEIDIAGWHDTFARFAMWSTPEQVAYETIEGVARNRAIIIAPRHGRIFTALIKRWPSIADVAGREVLNIVRASKARRGNAFGRRL